LSSTGINVVEEVASRLRSVVVCSDRNEKYWFGLAKHWPQENSTRYWLDGEKLNYEKWVPGEPNENAMCVLYTKDGFEDNPCHAKHYFTCKISATGKHKTRCIVAACLLQSNVLCFQQPRCLIYHRQRRRYMLLPMFLCLFVCLSVSKITQKRMHGYG